MRKVMTLILVMCLIFSMGISLAWAEVGVFTDTKGHWSENIVKEASQRGIVGGYPEGDFKPDNLMKREEFFKLITNVLNSLPDTSKTVLNFKDVDPIEWYVPTIKIVVAAGVSKGYDDGTIGVGQMISRQEAAKLVAGIIPDQTQSTDKTVATVKDSKQIADWAYQSVDKMFKKGYMQGDNDGNFRPTAALTRAEAATLLLNVKKNEHVLLGSNQKNTTVTPTPTPVLSTTSVGISDLSGLGTKKDPFVIHTANGLNKIRDYANDKAYFILEKDITITADYETNPEFDLTTKSNWSKANFAPIGTEMSPFNGYFDGNGKTIYGLNIEGEMKESGSVGQASYVGLFGYADKESVIDGVTIGKSNIKGRSNVGGICGYSEGQIINSTTEGDVTVTGSLFVGGICGYSEGVIEYGVNRATINGGTKIGGIVGNSNGKDTTISDCVNKGKIKGEDIVGGIAGFVSSANGQVIVEDCTNDGTVDGTNALAAGIVATVSRTDSITIQECINKAEVKGGNAGGVVGNNEGVITKCYNEGTVTGKNTAGGVCSFQTGKYAKVTVCYNDGQINSNYNAGGLVGDNEGRIYSAYNCGKIYGSSAVGGIAGKNGDMIWNVYNAGRVKGDNGVGSLVGRNAGELEDSFWLEATAVSDTGLSDSGASKSLIKLLTDDELSGKTSFRTGNNDGFIEQQLNNGLDENVWKLLSGNTYSYPDLIGLEK